MGTTELVLWAAVVLLVSNGAAYWLGRRDGWRASFRALERGERERARRERGGGI